MSRQIDLTKELSEDERNYLLDRGWTHMLDENAMHVMGGGVDAGEAEATPISGIPPRPQEPEGQDPEGSEAEGEEGAEATTEPAEAPKGRGRK